MERRRRQIVSVVILIVILGTVYMVVFGSKSRRTEQDMSDLTQIPYNEAQQSNILIAYFTGADNMPREGLDAVTSASVKEVDGELVGNTEYVAIRLQEYVHGDLFSIKTNRLYSQNYTLSTMQALGEQELNVKPRLVSHVEDFEQYDVIFLGYPAWWMDVPIAIESFIAEYDFSGKTVIPFTTHNSSGLGGTVEKIQTLIPEAEVLAGISIQENTLDSDRLNEILEKYLEEYIAEGEKNE
ncbi:MAG: flavodoxin [Lachnospiraceae bacterium]|nr:flavodoxin [Lachnospiraceae bacterium]